MQRTMPDGRPTTIATGAANEDVAETYLRRRGYRIIERNFKTKIGELDIIARDGGVLCFVEVRSRTSTAFGDAIEIGRSLQARAGRRGWRSSTSRGAAPNSSSPGSTSSVSPAIASR